jgi:hypothetical protein
MGNTTSVKRDSIDQPQQSPLLSGVYKVLGSSDITVQSLELLIGAGKTAEFLFYLVNGSTEPLSASKFASNISHLFNYKDIDFWRRLSSDQDTVSRDAIESVFKHHQTIYALMHNVKSTNENFLPLTLLSDRTDIHALLRWQAMHTHNLFTLFTSFFSFVFIGGITCYTLPVHGAYLISLYIPPFNASTVLFKASVNVL